MKNWTIREATKVIIEGTDTEAIRELAKHFPEFFMAVAKNDLLALTGAMGEKMTVRRLDFDLSDDGTDEVEDDEAEAEVPAAAKRAAKQTAKIEANIDEGNLEALSTKQLMALCDKRGIKVPHYGKNKQFYLAALQGAEDGSKDEEEEAETDPYAGMNAMQLYKACKEKGIKAEAKQKAAYYRDLLAKAETKANDGDEDWDDDEAEAETEAEAPKAKGGKAKSGKAKGTKKAAKAEPEAEAEIEDDDDDWEI